MGVLTILNLVTGVATVIPALITEAIAIKNALSKSGSNFQVDIQTLATDIVKTTGDDIADIEAWNAAHPA
jgi:hypothetical protein